MSALCVFDVACISALSDPTFPEIKNNERKHTLPRAWTLQASKEESFLDATTAAAV